MFILIEEASNIIITVTVPEEYSIGIFDRLIEDLGLLIVGIMVYFKLKNKLRRKYKKAKKVLNI